VAIVSSPWYISVLSACNAGLQKHRVWQLCRHFLRMFPEFHHKFRSRTTFA